MPSLSTLALAALVPLARLASAHFTVQYPATIGAFSDDDEPEAPCGGYTPDFAANNVTDFHVGGDAVVTTSFHTSISYLYRLTTDATAQGNWTQIYPTFTQSGLGKLCIPDVTVDDGLVGQNAVLSVVADSPDGILYQCAAVKLVSGTGTAPSACSNASSVSAAYAADDTLTNLLSGNATATSSGTSSSASASSTAAGSGASRMNGSPGGYGAVTAVFAMAVVGMALI